MFGVIIICLVKLMIVLYNRDRKRHKDVGDQSDLDQSLKSAKEKLESLAGFKKEEESMISPVYKKHQVWRI